MSAGAPPHQERGAWERQRKALLWQAHHLAEVPVLLFACMHIPLGADFAVTTTDDGGPGSLRDAFALASGSGEPNVIQLQEDATYALDDLLRRAEVLVRAVQPEDQNSMQSVQPEDRKLGACLPG